MSHQTDLFLKIIRKRKSTIIVTVISVLVITMFFTFLQPMRYRAGTRFLIIQKEGLSLDAYSALKSAERIGANLSQLVQTSTFFADVVAQDSSLANGFSDDPTIRRRQWKRTVEAEITPGTGILTINVYHQNQQTAKNFSDAIAAVLSQRVSQFWQENVQIQIVDYPVVSRYPVKPNIPVNALAGLFLGIVLSGVFIVLTER